MGGFGFGGAGGATPLWNPQPLHASTHQPLGSFPLQPFGLRGRPITLHDPDTRCVYTQAPFLLTSQILPILHNLDICWGKLDQLWTLFSEISTSPHPGRDPVILDRPQKRRDEIWDSSIQADILDTQLQLHFARLMVAVCGRMIANKEVVNPERYFLSIQMLAGTSHVSQSGWEIRNPRTVDFTVDKIESRFMTTAMAYEYSKYRNLINNMIDNVQGAIDDLHVMFRQDGREMRDLARQVADQVGHTVRWPEEIDPMLGMSGKLLKALRQFKKDGHVKRDGAALRLLLGKLGHGTLADEYGSKKAFKVLMKSLAKLKKSTKHR